MSLKYFARYRFNGGDVAEEDYGIRDLAVESGALGTVEDPVYGSCLVLDGATSLLSTGDFNNIADDTDRCFSWWAKVESTFASPVLCYGELASPNAFVLYARNLEGYPEFYDYSVRKSPVTDSVPLSTWTFFTISCGAGVVDIYVNGSLIYSDSVTLTTGTTDPLRIGTDGEGEYLQGNLLDLRVWETALNPGVITYMYSVGPNFEENLGTFYAEDTSRTSIMAGNLLCRTMYGVQEEGSVLTESFFGVADDSEPHEAARIEHGQDDSGMASETIRVRDTDDALKESILLSPSSTTFSSHLDNVTSSVIFSSDGVQLDADGEKGSIYFGAGRDFRLRVDAGTFVVEAYSSVTESYTRKMEVGS